MTADEFMDYDGGGQLGKLELIHGEIYAMSPASGTHSLIQAEIGRLLGNHLQKVGSPCRVGTEAPVRPALSQNNNVRAPDLAVTCDPPSSDEKYFPNPVLIIEIMSPSNRRETWESISACATNASVTELLVIESERIGVSIFRRNEAGEWGEQITLNDGEDELQLTSIGFVGRLKDVYATTGLT